ncbi:hypothetical protein E8E14_007031 [Neopestalotiopsis sp. 37M]|nr:hypothetical protein E8E14_007031 [Neopestalotiopsis sp. 37M]
MPVTLFIPEIVTAIIGGSAIGGSIASWCAHHHGRPGCAKSDVINENVPIVALMGRQAAVGPCNVPQYNFDQCHQQLQGVTVTTSIPQEGEGRFDNVPPACMNLAVVLTGSCGGNSARPTPCGSACLLYTGLTDSDYAQISKTLNA